MKKIGVVVPCHNEELVLRETTRRLAILLQGLNDKGKISSESKVYFVDDGSQDETWKIICDSAEHHPFVEGIKLSRNRGHQSALLAGLMHAKGDCLISIDADLQDDLSAIEKMVDAHAAGSDIVYGVRKGRNSDTPFKRFSAELYYCVFPP
jgi:polyisoprenyl-phosphate glycosyltransferase